MVAAVRAEMEGRELAARAAGKAEYKDSAEYDDDVAQSALPLAGQIYRRAVKDVAARNNLVNLDTKGLVFSCNPLVEVAENVEDPLLVEDPAEDPPLDLQEEEPPADPVVEVDLVADPEVINVDDQNPALFQVAGAA